MIAAFILLLQGTRVEAGTTSSTETITVAQLKKVFNGASGNTRLIVLISPTCPPCVYGHGAVLDTLKKVDRKDLKVFVVWLPVRPGDSLTEAKKHTSTDTRVRELWNADGSVDRAFMPRLKLSRSAFDTYLVFGPDSKWSTDIPPPPKFWMHQRGPQSGADQNMRFKAKRLQAALLQL